MIRQSVLAFVLAFSLAPLAVPSMAVAADSESTRARIAERFPGTEASDVIPSPVPGLYEVTVGPVILYVTEDGRYLLRGNLFDLKTDTNLTAQREESARSAVIAGLDDDELITYAGDEVRHTITVFTDTSCSYCRKFHREIEDYNRLGIKVRYALFPRNGMAAESWQVMERVACAKDRHAALTAAKQGLPVQASRCEGNPVMDQWQLGRMLGIRGTPAILTEDGQLIPGYLPPERLLDVLEKRQAGR